jgi:hypothetical protein
LQTSNVQWTILPTKASYNNLEDKFTLGFTNVPKLLMTKLLHEYTHKLQYVGITGIKSVKYNVYSHILSMYAGNRAFTRFFGNDAEYGVDKLGVSDKNIRHISDIEDIIYNNVITEKEAKNSGEKATFIIDYAKKLASEKKEL